MRCRVSSRGDAMNARSELMEIVQRLRSGEAGDEIDSQIWTTLTKDIDDEYRFNGKVEVKKKRPFTQSMEDARALVPRPFGSMSVATTFGVGGFGDSRKHSAWAWVSHDCSMAGGPGEPRYEVERMASPALALTAAALLALIGR